MQIYLQFSEREYLRAQLKDSANRAKMQIYLQFSEREYLLATLGDIDNVLITTHVVLIRLKKFGGYYNL